MRPYALAALAAPVPALAAPARRKLRAALTRAKGWAKAAAVAALGTSVQQACLGPGKWSRFRIERPPPGCTPLLVFINPRSGPQVRRVGGGGGGRLRAGGLSRLAGPMLWHAPCRRLVCRLPAARLRAWGPACVMHTGCSRNGWLGTHAGRAERLRDKPDETEAQRRLSGPPLPCPALPGRRSGTRCASSSCSCSTPCR